MTVLTRGDRLKLRQILKSLIIVFTVVAAALIVFRIAIVPNIVLKKIKVDSDMDLSDSEILSLAGIDAGQYYYNLDTAAIKKRLENYPAVREASVQKIFPDKLHIYLYGRKAVAMSVLNVKEKSVPVAIDGEGVIFKSGDDLKSWDLPVISGVRFDSVELGTQFPEALRPLLEDLSTLKKKSSALYDMISEIQVEKRGVQGYDLVLFLQNYPVKALVGRRLNSKILTSIIMVFDVLKQQKLTDKIGEVDFRAKEIVYRLREEV